LSYLERFPIDTLKIDQSFVRQITLASDKTNLVTAIIGMGHNLSLQVVAEGVETREELEFLQSHGCDEAQGYYLGRPMPREYFAEMFALGLQSRHPVV
jgi:EAL domain-containing protein (putative c-di-GMP-specific phosphodiesterase class I)